MNDRPERDRDETDLGPDDNELEEEDFDAEALLDAVDEDDLDSLEDDEDDEFLPEEDDDEEVIEIPEQYAAAPAIPPPFAAPAVAEPVEALLAEDGPYEDEPAYADEPDFEEEIEQEPPPRSSPFDQAGPFAAPARGRGRQQRPATAIADTSASQGNRVPAVYTVFQPESNFGSMIGLGVTGLCVVIGLLLVLKSFSHDPSLTQFWTLAVGAVLLTIGGLAAYWTWGSLSLRYIVDRNALTIRWGAQRQVVPLANIERLIPADPEGDEPDVQGVDWPGHHVGKARVQQLGEVLFYSGHRRVADVLYVQTASHTYAISVPDAVAFAQTIQANQMRGSLFEQRQTVQRDGIAAQSFWLDPQARFLTFVLLASFAVVAGYVLNTYPGLAQSIPLPYPALGSLTRVADKSELLDIPRSAGVFLALNMVLAVLLHPWERMVSIVLLLAGIALQITLLVAAIVAVA